MPRSLKFFILAVLIMLAGSTPLAMQRELGSISGQVVNRRGPVTNAAVDARNLISGLQGQATTDWNGRYVIEGLRQGRYSMWVRAPGHESVWIARLIVVGGKVTDCDVYLRELRPEIVPTAFH